jgi:hypothetical protein
MRFQPSNYGSYGAEEEEEKKDGLTQAEAFLPAIRSFFFGESARVDAAKLRSQIENIEAKLASGAGVFHNYYVDDLNKKRAKLAELELIAGEERSGAEKEQITKTAITIGAVVGTIVIVGMAVNQIQKARLTQAKIRQIEG